MRIFNDTHSSVPSPEGSAWPLSPTSSPPGARDTVSVDIRFDVQVNKPDYQL